ncbi:MAG: UDP-N-acetylmuramoyl-tripeptide--D-alanyl-D-alanine ligase [Phycisphaerales bacterium]|nr:MAG: UDP-N-acetylmuramoyl-tripeptide--D-alanyl-D-alanine ligase [Phycisphaerales bacterium]
MNTLRFEEAIEAIAGRFTGPAPQGSVCGVSIDSRTVRAGELFVAVPGQRFDGHNYVEQAIERGARAAVVSRRDLVAAKAGQPLVWVDDTVVALGRLASYYRDQIAATVIAVTGSNGKTTTRAMIHHVLSDRRQGRQAQKSFNNQIGVPLTLLSAEGNDEFLVLELGTNHPGEIGALASIARPEMGVVVSIGPAHLEGLGSIEGVIREKTSLFRHVRKGGLAVVNRDCLSPVDELPEGVKLPVVSFGESAEAHVRLTAFEQRAEGVRFQYNDRFEVDMPVLGRHNALNALAAVVVARRLGHSDEEIAARLGTFSAPEMRLERMRLGDVELIFDAYNANPASVIAALDVLDASEKSGRQVLVIGDMGELGADSEKLHREIGRRIATTCIDVLVTVGPRAAVIAEECADRITRHSYGNSNEAAGQSGEWLRSGDLVVIKGSRAMKLEKIVEALQGEGKQIHMSAGSRT